MQLHLIDLRLDLAPGQEITNLLGREVRDAEMADQSARSRVFHRGVRLVDGSLGERNEIRRGVLGRTALGFSAIGQWTM